MKSSFSISLLFLTGAIIGFALWPKISVQYLPAKEPPSLTVSYGWVGASPEVVEQEVTSVLEGAFNLIRGVKQTYSVSKRNRGYINLELDRKLDITYLRFEVATKIRQLFPQFPDGVTFPIISSYRPDENINESPILIYSLSGQDSPTDLYQYAQEIFAPPLGLIQGIEKIEINGGNKLEWQIVYDDEICRNRNVKAESLLSAIQSHLKKTTIGHFQQGNSSLIVRLDNESINDADVAQIKKQLEQVPILNWENRTLYLKDFATIKLTEQRPTQYYRINGKNSIRILIYPDRGTNTLNLANNIKSNILQLQKDLPSTYQLYLDKDTTEYLLQELSKIGERTVVSLSIILGFILLLYRSFRYLIIIILSLAANLGLASIVYYLLGVEIHLYALAGITISFGIMVDNSVIMVHHLQQKSNHSIFPALLAATLTTVSALVIVYFLPEKWQLNLIDFAKVIAINLSISLLVAIWLIPALLEQNLLVQQGSIRISSKQRMLVRWKNTYERILVCLLNWKRLIILLMILTFGLPIFLLPNKIEGWNWYNQTIGNDWYTTNVKPHVNKYLGGTLRLFIWYVYDGAGYRDAEETVLHVQAGMPNGATLSQMNLVFKYIESYVDSFDEEIKQFVTKIHSGQYGTMRIYFEPTHQDAFPYLLKSKIIAYSINLGGVNWNIFGVGRGFNNNNGSMPPKYRMAMYGYNRQELKQQADLFANKLQMHPRIKTVNTQANVNWWERDLYEYEALLDKEYLAKLSIAPNTLQEIFDEFDLGARPDLYTPRQRPLRLVNKGIKQNDLWKLQNTALGLDSNMLRFGKMSTLTKKEVSSAIHKKNQQYIQMLEWEYAGAARFGDVYLKEQQLVMENELPLGYSMERDEYSYLLEKDKHQSALFFIIIVLIFFICSIQFESFKQSLAIVILIPLSFIGIFLTFYFFDFPFDQGGYTSFILLSGLVVNGLILIINDFNFYRKKYPGRQFVNNYAKAFQKKIIPILLTIISTSLGLLPFTMHGENEVFWFSLAVGTIGGLIFSLVVLIFLVPLFLDEKSR